MNHKKQQAFSLLELSIVIVIMGIVTTGVLYGSASLLRQNKIKATNAKLDSIQLALGRFVLTHGRLPCPVGPDTASGLEADSCGQGGGAGSGVFMHNNVLYGAVPYVSLEIPENVAVDSWGSKISYRVDAEFISDMSRATDGKTGIEPKSSGPDSSALSPRGAYVILSHGENRVGAYSAKTLIRTPLNYDDYYSDSLNANVGGDFIYSAPSEEGFDDLMRYKTKAQIVSDIDWQDIGCVVDRGKVNTLLSRQYFDKCGTAPGIILSFLMIGDSFQTSNGACKIVCYKYGRLGIVKNL